MTFAGRKPIVRTAAWPRRLRARALQVGPAGNGPTHDGTNDMRRAFATAEAPRNGRFRLVSIHGKIGRMPREQKITFGEMRESGVRLVLLESRNRKQ
jgi:hypothetical protein